MQTITFNDSTLSVHIFEDADTITASNNNIACPEFIIADMNFTNATIHTGVTPPNDWQGGKYTFDGTSWAATAGWVDPKVAEIARLQSEIDALNA